METSPTPNIGINSHISPAAFSLNESGVKVTEDKQLLSSRKQSGAS